ncbi:MAG TPA: helix-turn-helix transcriptional regulator, partial [Pseudonocardia sp.]|nr:helix-turn-helix transcriptional regulator [Pseudonocardia sp.]
LSATGERKGSPRRTLLRAWLDMLAGRVDDAASALAAVEGTPLLRRDAVLGAAVAVGLARRGRDREELAATWRRVSPVVAGADVEPLLVDAWGELSVAAAMVAPTEAEVLAEAIAAAVHCAGRPAWLAEAELWWRLKRAVVLGDGRTATDTAHALARLARDERTARLADAARVWAQVMAGAVDGTAVTEAATALAASGRAWAAAELYRTAASRVTEPTVAKALLRKSRRLGSAARPGAAMNGGGLTAREKDVGALILDGLTYREIGMRLYISPKTVEQHVARLRQKLAASTRAQLVAALRGRLVAAE